MDGETPKARKDTVLVPPKQTVTVDFDTDNPGKWISHYHNTYHLEAGYGLLRGVRLALGIEQKQHAPLRRLRHVPGAGGRVQEGARGIVVHPSLNTPDTTYASSGPGLWWSCPRHTAPGRIVVIAAFAPLGPVHNSRTVIPGKTSRSGTSDV